MDWQKAVDNALHVQREAIPDKSKPVLFNEQYHPVGLDSWRGSYCELALEYEATGEPLTVAVLLKKLRDAIGATFSGYKGGEFRMGKTTPVWVANYGECDGFIGHTQAVVGVSENEQAVLIETKALDY